jgi:TRAP transporter TAXI family solute receptor
METMTRRQAITWIGIGVGMSLGHGIRPGPLMAQTRAHLSLATAGRGGAFYPLGTGMAALISKYMPGVEATAQLTGGSAANMKLLHEGNVELALTLADSAWDAAQGQLGGLPEKVPVRTLLGTYSGYMHIVTLEGLGITTVADLKGKRVSTGLPGSGTEVKGVRVFEAYGVTPQDLGRHDRLDYGEAAQALRDGTLDAFLWDAGLPGKVILDLAATPGGTIRLLPTGDAVPPMVAKYGPLYFVAAIPKGTYPGVNEDVSAAAGTNLLVTHERMEEPLAYEITKLLLERTPELVPAYSGAREITLRSAVRGSPIPFHPGALRYYKEQGITVPSP